MIEKLIEQELPHNRFQKLMVRGDASELLRNSMERWINSLLVDDGISSKIENDGIEVNATITCKQEGVFAGKVPINFLLENWIPGGRIEYKKDDGERVKFGDVLMILSMSAEQILKFERTILNIIGRLSGIATTTSLWTDISTVPIAATRKTTWGLLDKWAVHHGGGLTHRLSRKDSTMIKENDFMAFNTNERDYKINIINTLKKVNKNSDFLVVEARGHDEAITIAEIWFEINKDCFPFTIMLDNMSPNECLSVSNSLESIGVRKQIILEASGGITLEHIDRWSNSGIDLISTSAIHRGTTPLDISLIVLKEG